MKRESKNLSIFLSPPCYIKKSELITESSWYKFILNFGFQNDHINIVSPTLEQSSEAFIIRQNRLSLKKINHFYYDSFKSYYKNLILKPFVTIRIYFKLIKSSDLIIFRIPNPGFAIISFMAFCLKKPVVVFISGNIVDQSDTFKNSKGILRIFLKLVLIMRKGLHRIMFSYSSYIFPVSTELLDLYKINKKSNIEILRTPVISAADLTLKINKKFIYQDKKRLKIIRVCWLQESKGIENLISAVNNLKNNYRIELDIYGDSKDEKYKEKLIKLIENFNLFEHVKLKGWVSNDKLKEIYNNYDLHLMSSISEGMPRVCLEASSRGLPQILTPVGGIYDFYSHLQDAYICEDSSINSIQKGIIWFISNPEKVVKMTENSLENAKKGTIEEVSKDFNKILERFL